MDGRPRRLSAESSHPSRSWSSKTLSLRLVGPFPNRNNTQPCLQTLEHTLGQTDSALSNACPLQDHTRSADAHLEVLGDRFIGTMGLLVVSQASRFADRSTNAFGRGSVRGRQRTTERIERRNHCYAMMTDTRATLAASPGAGARGPPHRPAPPQVTTPQLHSLAARPADCTSGRGVRRESRHNRHSALRGVRISHPRPQAAVEGSGRVGALDAYRRTGQAFAEDGAVQEPRPRRNGARHVEACVLAWAGYAAHEQALDRPQWAASRERFGSGDLEGSSGPSLLEVDRGAPARRPKPGGRVSRKVAPEVALGDQLLNSVGAKGALFREEVGLGRPGTPQIGCLTKERL